ncbi:MAG: M14 family metallopeptidase [Bacillota bacterium]|nr:M14 family metallopeptidase [Bacillota bacterium]
MATVSVTTPEQFFGHRLGTDRKIARWDRIVEYFGQLAAKSDRIKVVEMGKSTEGNTFLLAIISSPANLSDLERYREISRKLSDPRGLGEDEIRALVAGGKAIVCQSMSLHATEIGGTQMAPELAYDLLAGDDEDTRRILDNVIFLMVPCFNPDGQIMVTDWYDRWIGTEYEGSQYPKLYQKYTGHDNNRDALTQNMVEARYMAEILFTTWRPQAYLDHHHQGSNAARFNIPPYSNPIHPHGDPLAWQEINWYGGHMAQMLEAAGKSGVLHSARYEGWGHLGFHWITIYHNIAGMLTESASAKLATPMYVHPDQLVGASPRTMPRYEAQVNFPNPWPGGWWRLRDIVEQQKVSAWALLDIAARCKEMVLYNYALKAGRQTERGRTGKPFAYVIPACQHDPLTARKLLQALLNQGIELHAAAEPFEAGDCMYPAGTHVAFMRQPKMGLIKTLLGRTLYPDGYWTRTDNGTPIVRDAASDTIAEYMGVDVVPVDEEFCGTFTVVTELARPVAEVASAGGGVVFDGRLNDSYRAANRLLARGIKVSRTGSAVETCCGCMPAGAFYLEPGAADDATLCGLAGELGVGFSAARTAPDSKREIRPKRVAIYQRYWAGNMDEGWTRWVLEQFEFPYVTLMDAEIRSGKLAEMIDVLILPSDTREMMVGPMQSAREPRVAEMLGRFGKCPPEYQSGFGPEGVKAIGEFVAAGGRLVAFDASYKLAIEACGLGVRNVAEGLDTKRFLTHGSTLRVRVDNSDPLTYGMPREALIVSWDSPVFEVTESFAADAITRLVTFPERDVLQSGWLIGEELVAGKSAMVRARSGKGEVVLLGMRAQNRGQAHGTFKLVFNCLY